MMLISLLIALCIDRYYQRGKKGYLDYYLGAFNRYLIGKQLVQGKQQGHCKPADGDSLAAPDAVNPATTPQVMTEAAQPANGPSAKAHTQPHQHSQAGYRSQLIVLLAPALLIGGTLLIADTVLFTFVVQTLVLTLALGMAGFRHTFRCFKDACKRGDTQAAYLYVSMLTQRQPAGESPDTCMAKAVLWLSYRYYATIIIIFAALGVPGVLIYCTARMLAGDDCHQQPVSLASRCLHIVDFIPVRITTLGFLLVGHFSRAAGAWLKGVGQISLSAQAYLIAVGQRAEELEQHKNTLCTDGAVQLAKRNMGLLVVASAVLTLTGVLI